MGKFKKDLEDGEHEEWVEKYYWEWFPDLYDIEIVTDIEKQKQGVDIILYTESGNIIVDEKKRLQHFSDILLEEYSCWDRKTPGWTHNPDHINDFVLYYFNVKPWRVHLLDAKFLREKWFDLSPCWLSLAADPNKEICCCNNTVRSCKKCGRRFGSTSDLYQTSNIPVGLVQLIKSGILVHSTHNQFDKWQKKYGK